MKRLETYGHVDESGILKISYRDKFNQAVKMFAGRRIRLVVEPLYKKRSTAVYHDDGSVTRGQNGYYHTILVEEYRNGAWETQQRMLTHDQAHDELKANCNYLDRYNDETGEVMRTISSTADYTTVQFEEYLTRCRAFILEWFGIDCPLPGTQTEMELKTTES